MTPRSHNRLGADVVLDALTMAVMTVDHQMRVTAVNSACENLFGISRRHALNLPLAEGIPHFAPHIDRLSTALETHAGFIDRELSLQKFGDAPVTVDCTVSPMALNGKPGLLIEVLALDRQLRISRDEQLLAQHQASRELIRGLAHEIKNPLGGIRGAAQLLERELPDASLREYTQVIIKEADRLKNLVNRLLGPNRLPQKAPINLHEVLEHVRQLVQVEASPAVRFVRDYDPSIPEIVADREQLIQAVLNVVRNALQAVDADGTIVLRSRTQRQFNIAGVRHRLVAQIEIEDNGPGIAPAIIEKVFYPMVTTRADGTGLGLPIAQYLIHGHGGLIECRSKPGSTVFTFYLPLESP